MKKWIVVSVVGGTLSMLQLAGAAPSPASVAVPVAAVAVEPCPTCCPPEICTYNGPSFDGTTVLTPVAHSGD